MRRWEAGKRCLAPYVAAPLSRCSGAWQAVRPCRALQQASEEPTQLAELIHLNGHDPGPLTHAGSINSQGGEFCDGLQCSDFLYTNAHRSLFSREQAQHHEHLYESVQNLDGEEEANGVHEEGSGDVTEAEYAGEQTGSWGHAKVE